MPPYKYIFVDLDDTIWDFERNAKSSLMDVFDSKHLNRYFDSFEHFFDLYITNNTLLWKLYSEGKVTKAELNLQRFKYPFLKMGVEVNDEFVLQMGSDYLNLLPEKTALMPYAHELLEYLSPRYPLTIVSNGFIEVQQRKMESSGIGHYFSHVVLSENVGALKPDKRIFEHALLLNNAQPHETIMLGDNFEADICGAQNAGIDTIYFNPKGKPILETQTPPTFHIQSLEETISVFSF